MINRISYQFNNLPPNIRQEDVISYLEAQSNYGELTVHAGSDTATMSLVIPRLYIYQYQDYLVDVIPLNGQLYITCHKITPGILIQKCAETREKLAKLNAFLSDFDKEIRIKEYYLRKEARLMTEEHIRTIKRDIKQELTRIGVKISPGSQLNKLLKLDR